MGIAGLPNDGLHYIPTSIMELVKVLFHGSTEDAIVELFGSIRSDCVLRCCLV